MQDQAEQKAGFNDKLDRVEFQLLRLTSLPKFKDPPIDYFEESCADFLIAIIKYIRMTLVHYCRSFFCSTPSELVI
jgi:hypothetical protein